MIQRKFTLLFLLLKFAQLHYFFKQSAIFIDFFLILILVWHK